MRKRLFPKHKSPPASEPSPDLQAILEELKSPDEKCRAEAVRKLCPCRGTVWSEPVFPRVIELRNDPSPVVRQAVEHDLNENKDWGMRSEARKMEGQRVRGEYRQVEAEIKAVLESEAEEISVPPPHSLGWRTHPRRRTPKKHRLG
ncbi:MAG: hypothetical protein KY468_04965 [Armatimonadetes bacterium]|nr:hypothetical protein [Armatimonadota bacterium]